LWQAKWYQFHERATEKTILFSVIFFLKAEDNFIANENFISCYKMI